MRIVPVVLVFFMLGCSAKRPVSVSGGPSPAQVVATNRLCAADRVGDQVKSWREVTGDGFTYCVPEDWQPVGDRAQLWRSPAVDFSWGEAHGPFDRYAPAVNTARGQRSAPFGTRVVTHTIDGRILRLELRDAGPDGTNLSAAQWLEPALKFYGDARTASATDEILTAFASVRFGREPR